MAAEHAAVDMDDVARFRRARQQPLDHVAVVAGGHEADVLAVGLVGDRRGQTRGRARAPAAFGRPPSGKRSIASCSRRRGEQEIALVAVGIGGAVERPPARAVVLRDDVMAGRQDVGAEIARRLEQVDELHVLVAGDAGDRRLARDIGARERLDHLLAEAALVIEHVMGHAEALPRRRARRGCPGRRSRRPCDASPRHGRRAASSRRPRHSPRAPAAPRRRWNRRRPTSPRRRACRPAPWAGRGC